MLDTECVTSHKLVSNAEIQTMKPPDTQTSEGRDELLLHAIGSSQEVANVVSQELPPDVVFH